jgi:hypothetical protein
LNIFIFEGIVVFACGFNAAARLRVQAFPALSNRGPKKRGAAIGSAPLSAFQREAY